MLTCECHVSGTPLDHLSACMHAAGQLRDAVGVCANELADPQLAIFLCRLLEPAGGYLLQHLLADELLPRVSISSSSFTKNTHIHECRSQTVLQELHQDKNNGLWQRGACVNGGHATNASRSALQNISRVVAVMPTASCIKPERQRVA